MFGVVMVTIATVLIAAVWIRRRMLIAGPPHLDATTLTGEQVGLLTGGVPRATLAALAELRVAGAVEVQAGRLVRTGEPPADAGPLAVALWHAAGSTDRARSLPAGPGVADAVQTMTGHLERGGWRINGVDRERVEYGGGVLIGAAIVTLVLVFIAAGLGERIGWSVAALVALVVTGTALFRPPETTRAAEAALARLQAARPHLDPSVRPALRTYGPAVAALAVGLHGGAVLLGTDPVFVTDPDLVHVGVPGAAEPATTSDAKNSSGGGAGGGGCGGCGGCGGGCGCGG